jgi:hypothetical protein
MRKPEMDDEVYHGNLGKLTEKKVADGSAKLLAPIKATQFTNFIDLASALPERNRETLGRAKIELTTRREAV